MAEQGRIVGPDGGVVDIDLQRKARISFREVAALVVFLVGVGTWIQSIRQDVIDLKDDVVKLERRIDAQENTAGSTAVTLAEQKEKLNAILDRVTNVESYMRKLTQ